MDLDLKPCNGCESCVMSVYKGGSGKCVIKGDDMSFLLEKFTDCDGMIFGIPVYFLTPPGSIRVMNDRMVGYNMKMVKDGPAKKRVAGIISVGGTDWVSLALPLMYTLLHPPQVSVVDQIQVVFSARPGQVLLDGPGMSRVRNLGRNVAEAMRAPDRATKFMGDDPGQCPVCHSDVLVVRKKAPVECAICGSRGVLKVVGDEISVAFNEEDLKKPRWSKSGLLEHVWDISKVHDAAERGKEEIKSKSEKYRSYKSCSLPPPKVS
jgi:multimeric flavodoxin WrbA